jgi:hypothetical protein
LRLDGAGVEEPAGVEAHDAVGAAEHVEDARAREVAQRGEAGEGVAGAGEGVAGAGDHDAAHRGEVAERGAVDLAAGHFENHVGGADL